MMNVTIGISDLKTARSPDVLVTYALGSCVGICLLDPTTNVGGLSHIMLPDSTQAYNGASMPMRYADTAIPMLIQKMQAMGANKSRLRAKIAGGAVMFATSSEKFNIGGRNIEAVRAALRKEGIPIIAEDVGKNYGRTVYFYTDSGIMEIRAAARGNTQF